MINNLKGMSELRGQIIHAGMVVNSDELLTCLYSQTQYVILANSAKYIITVMSHDC